MREPGSPRSFPDPAAAPVGRELLAIGGTLASGDLVAAYRAGLFPMPLGSGPRTRIGWFSPDPRGILPVEAFHASRSLRRSTRGFRLTIDQAFDQVVAGCADPRRPNGWIDERMIAAYRNLHRTGLAHSIEVWSAGDGVLAGGLFGVEIGGLFAAESMFHRVTDASKAAVAELVRLLASDSARSDRLIDVQWLTPHLAGLGAVELDRPDYLRRLRVALKLPSILGPNPI